MKIRDRVKELRRVRAGDLLPNPKNWRTHPKEQQDALRGLLEEIGFAGALLVRKTRRGLMLIDGHLRANTSPDAIVPVLVLDVTEEEADKILATLDPLAALAGADTSKLDGLLSEVKTGSAAVQELLDGLAARHGPRAKKKKGDPEQPHAPDRPVIVVDCASEEQQRDLLQQFKEEGLSCRASLV